MASEPLIRTTVHQEYDSFCAAVNREEMPADIRVMMAALDEEMKNFPAETSSPITYLVRPYPPTHTQAEVEDRRQTTRVSANGVATVHGAALASARSEPRLMSKQEAAELMRQIREQNDEAENTVEVYRDIMEQAISIQMRCADRMVQLSGTREE